MMTLKPETMHAIATDQSIGGLLIRAIEATSDSE